MLPKLTTEATTRARSGGRRKAKGAGAGCCAAEAGGRGAACTAGAGAGAAGSWGAQLGAAPAQWRPTFLEGSKVGLKASAAAGAAALRARALESSRLVLKSLESSARPNMVLSVESKEERGWCVGGKLTYRAGELADDDAKQGRPRSKCKSLDSQSEAGA